MSSTVANTSMKRFSACSIPWPLSSANSSRNAANANIAPYLVYSQLALRGMPLEGEFDQSVQQLRIGQAVVLPHLGIHADGRKAGNCVYLVDEDSSRGALDQEVDARHAFAAERLEACDRQTADLLDAFGRYRRRDPELGLVEQVLVFVVVEVPGGKHLARRRRLRIFIAQVRSTRSPGRRSRARRSPCDRTARPLRSRLRSSLAIRRFRDSDRRSEIGGLDEHRIAEARLERSRIECGLRRYMRTTA